MRHPTISSVEQVVSVAAGTWDGPRWLALLVPLVVAGCHQTTPDAVEVLPFGSRSDMVTELGAHPGYTLAVDCGDATVGRGDLTLVGDASKPPVDVGQLKQLKDVIVVPSVRDIDFYAGIGFGRVCHAWGIFITLSSWAVVDPAIARLGLLVDMASSRINIELRIVPPGSK